MVFNQLVERWFGCQKDLPALTITYHVRVNSVVPWTSAALDVKCLKIPKQTTQHFKMKSAFWYLFWGSW